MQTEAVSAQPLSAVSRLGETARSFLSPGSHGKVLAATSGATYMTSHKGDLFWLAAKGSAMHRRCIELAGPLPGIVADTEYAVTDHVVALGPHLVLDFSRGSSWSPAPPSPERIPPTSKLPGFLSAALSVFIGLPSPKGFGVLIPSILSGANDRLPSWPLGRLGAAVRHAWPAVREIVHACLSHDSPRLLEHAEELIGLGEGLTPSGDDFVGGLLFWLSAMEDAHALTSPPQPSDVVYFLERSKPRTNLISFTLLADHAEGHSFEALHHLTDALLTGRHLGHIRQQAAGLIRLGHSTGWDLLTGVIAGMLTVPGVATPIRLDSIPLPSLHPS